MRPIQIWVPDVHAAKFAEEAGGLAVLCWGALRERAKIGVRRHQMWCGGDGSFGGMWLEALQMAYARGRKKCC